MGFIWDDGLYTTAYYNICVHRYYYYIFFLVGPSPHGIVHPPTALPVIYHLILVCVCVQLDRNVLSYTHSILVLLRCPRGTGRLGGRFHLHADRLWGYIIYYVTTAWTGYTACNIFYYIILSPARTHKNRFVFSLRKP